MANVLNRTTKQYIPSANTPDYPPAEWIINPDLSAVEGVPVKYWKIAGDNVLEMNQQEKNTVDAAERQARIDSEIAKLDLLQDAVIEAFRLVLSELNAHALKINQILDAADNAVNLADFKARVLLITDYPQRTPAQFKASVKAGLEAQ